MGNSLKLLDDTRRLGKLWHDRGTDKVLFADVCSVLSQILDSTVMVISRKGKVLGHDESGKAPVISEELSLIGNGDFIDRAVNERLLAVLSTKENVNLETLGCREDRVKGCHAIIAPIEVTGDRLGTLFLSRLGDEYDIDSIILCEYATTVVGLELLRAESEENAEESRKRSEVRAAAATLSAAEKEAVIRIFDELGGNEGILVASRIAENSHLARSVVVNALRKLESGGVVESRSSGMKGTFIRVRNEFVYEEVERLKKS